MRGRRRYATVGTVALEVRARLRAVMPWLVALTVLAWLFHAVPASELRAALARVSLPAFAAVVVAYVGTLLAADALALWATLRRSIPDVPLAYGEVFRLRAATYLLAIIHYGVGQGGIAYFLKSRHGVELSRAAGAVMLTMGVNAIMIAACAALGVMLGGAPSSSGLRAVVLALGCGMPAYLGVIAARPRFLLRSTLLAPLFDAGLRGHAAMAAARLPHIVALIVGNYVAMRVFGIHPPVGQALALLPLVFIVAVLPISPSGLGTAQATAVALFWPFAPGDTPVERQAAVLAWSLALQFGALPVQAGIGLAFLRSVIRAGSLDSRDAGAIDRAE